MSDKTTSEGKPFPKGQAQGSPWPKRLAMAAGIVIVLGLAAAVGFSSTPLRGVPYVPVPVAAARARDPRQAGTGYRPGTAPNAPFRVGRITCASARSATIVDVTDGPIGGTAMLMRGGAVDRAPQNRSVSPQRSDVGVAKQYDRRIEDE